VTYIEKDVVANREYMMELVKQYRVMKVPSIVIDGDIIVGFEREKLTEILGL
jgi:tRNA A37 methylthiotransferase MiaB